MYAVRVSARPPVARERRGVDASTKTNRMAVAFATKSVGPAPKWSKPAERIGFISPCCCQPMYVATPSKSCSARLRTTRITIWRLLCTGRGSATWMPPEAVKTLRNRAAGVPQSCTTPLGRRGVALE